MFKWGALALVAFLMPAEASTLQEAIEHRDVLKLEVLSKDATAPDEARLATGAALSLRHKDEAALAILQPLSRSADTDIRGAACLALADITLREGRYAETREALTCARAARPLTDEAQQVLTYAEILSGERPMQLVQPAAGKLAVRRDGAGLIQVRITVNGHEKSAVIDTDASFCVVSDSVAERLGVRVLEKPATIITSTRTDQPMHLGVADELKLGDVLLRHVVFAVLPDAAVRFGPTYKMEAVIGLPVLVALQRIALKKEEGAEALYYGPKAEASRTGEDNMVLSGLDPFVLAKEARTGAILRLALDTAADKTTLNATALKQFPTLGEGSSSTWVEWQGAGGSRTDVHARSLPDFILDVAGRPVALKRVKAYSSNEQDRHGAIGQDVLKQGSGWVMDFDVMRFVISD